MSGFQSLSDLAPITMAALSNPKKDGESQEEWVERIAKVLKVKDNKEEIK